MTDSVKDFVDQFARLEAEKLSRQKSTRRLKLTRYVPNFQTPNEIHVALPGTITAFIGRFGNPLLTAVRHAAESSAPMEKTTFDAIQRQYATRQQVCLNEAVDMAIASSTIGVLRYGDLTLLPDFFLPDTIDVAFVQMPYNGASLDCDAFIFDEFRSNTPSSVLDVVLVAQAPQLSPLEEAAMSIVPSNLHELHTAPNVEIAWSPAIAVVAVVATTALLCVAAFSSSTPIHIPDEEILALGPETTAKRLLKLRKDWLTGNQSVIPTKKS